VIEDPIVQNVIAVVALLLVAAVSAVGLRRARLPYSVGLVLVGLVLGFVAEHLEFLEFAHELELSPEIILFIFLPTLIFESAFNLDARLLSQNLLPVFALAAPGLLLSTAIIGVVVAVFTPLNWGPALIFGALISATDPVAVVALFKELGAPKRLAILVEGESLFNDATAIVLFHLILTAVVGGAFTAGTVGDGVASFMVVFVGGLTVGALIGYLMVRSIAVAENDPLVEVALSTVVAYAAFIAAEHYLGVSGVMATVGAGIVIGAFGTPRFTPPVRAFLKQFWEYAAFVANGLIFLLVGLSVSFSGLFEFLGPIAWAIAAATVARGVVTFGLIPAVARLPGAEPIDFGYRVVLWWGGLRGAVALALAFSLEPGFPGRDLIVAMAVGVVLFTLLTGGLSMSRLLAALGLDQPNLVERVARAQATRAAKEAALKRVDRMATAGHFSPRLVRDLEQEYRRQAEDVRVQLSTLQSECDESEVTHALWFEALAVERAVYRELLDQGFITEPVLRELELTLSLQRDGLKRGTTDFKEDQLAPLEVRVASVFFDVINRFAPRARFVERHRLRTVAARYERDAAVFEASKRVVTRIERLAELSGAPRAVVEVVRTAYRDKEQRATDRLDSVAEHFPEYVEAVQLRTARRIALDAEADAIQSLTQAGGIPASIAEDARMAVERAQRELTRRPVAALAGRPAELLQRVPLFENLSPEDFQRFVERLRSITVLAGRTIIREGERGNSLFLIARGVVGVFRAERDGQGDRIATLHAGDFFGETALLTDKPRTASVKAATDCQLYELTKKEVDALCHVCVGAREALEAALSERYGQG
jgi:CPA1 family monovalent cation:H+ antiporter